MLACLGNLYPVCVIGSILQNFAYKRCRNSNCFAVNVGYYNLFCSVIVSERRADKTQLVVCKGKLAYVERIAFHCNGSDVSERKTYCRTIDFQGGVVKFNGVVVYEYIEVDILCYEVNTVCDIILGCGYAVVYGPETVVVPAFEYRFRLYIVFKFGKVGKVSNGCIVVISVDRLTRGVVFTRAYAEHSVKSVLCVTCQNSELCPGSANNRITCVNEYVTHCASTLAAGDRSVVLATCGNSRILYKYVFDRAFTSGRQEITRARDFNVSERDIFKHAGFGHRGNERVTVSTVSVKSVDDVTATVEHALESFGTVGFTTSKHNH